VSTVGLDERQIRQYIKEQEELQKKQLEFDLSVTKIEQYGIGSKQP